MPVSVIEDRMLVELLCSPMTETARAEKLGITRPSYYRLLDRLNRNGILRRRGELEPGMTLKGSHPRSKYSGTHHAPVQQICWQDTTGQWAVQGALLGRWVGDDSNNTIVAIRWRCINNIIRSFSFEVRPLNRWSTLDTHRHLPPGWRLHSDSLKNITIAIAKLIDAEAVIVSENGNMG